VPADRILSCSSKLAPGDEGVFLALCGPRYFIELDVVDMPGRYGWSMGMGLVKLWFGIAWPGLRRIMPGGRARENVTRENVEGEGAPRSIMHARSSLAKPNRSPAGCVDVTSDTSR
jgi:hypothetical protein